jgi:hypothetical protein
LKNACDDKFHVRRFNLGIAGRWRDLRIRYERVKGCLHSGHADLYSNSKLRIGNVSRSDKEEL